MSEKNILQLAPEDLKQLASRGMDRSNLEWQFDTLKNPPAKLQIKRPCTIDDGILLIADEHRAKLSELADAAVNAGEVLDFIPASGAATRMFADLLAALKHPQWLESAASLARLANSSDSSEKKTGLALQSFFENLKKFAFFAELAKAVSKATGGRFDLLTAAPGDYFQDHRAALIIELLLNNEGLGYAQKPKALLLFHNYPAGARTALEEHLVNASQTIRGKDGVVRMHFTVSPEHEALARNLLKEALPALEQRAKCRFEVSFSFQDPATDTIALDQNGAIFRNPEGGIVFRAGGHGSLLKNLEETKARIVYLNNIDNVQPDWGKAESQCSKRLMIGLLLDARSKVCGALSRLRQNPTAETADAIYRDLLPSLNIRLPAEKWELRDTAQKVAQLERLLKRPIRVCGMVKNEGEVGGGPFWVENHEGFLTPQIVEQAELDTGDPEQKTIFLKATHFNPVRIVCNLRDCPGEPFKLADFVNKQAVFTSTKDLGGQRVKILERPGLWNGSMADWISLFVEVDLKTFTPVKTVIDLARPAHQSPA